jgi:ATP-dependent Zn protease
MPGHTTTWVNLLISWLPFLLLIAFWVYFMKRGLMKKQGQYLDRHLELMEQQQRLLERIATALEARRNDPR